jgi:NAD(P) transhydrogenase subunit alpha
MNEALVLAGVFLVTFGVGIFLIVKVPPRLHTPLMSMTNAISGIAVVGALLLFAADSSGLQRGLGAIAVVAGAFNLVGGFAVTSRMLSFFKKRETPHG